ncbi:hypothetical protein PoB_005740200 [Plakobranchus ocellatus]|uniref:Uncharacterized protein n=1 Tax=Plakobranchus ocellatus TaxID=259542 RepID=A0AAV4CH29_9GAST|nr:hypothetical protein PoB_005740200 [Plakobranchus ocellatus]
MEVFFAEVIKHFRWPRVTLVTIATPVWQETMTEFEARIELEGVEVRRWTIESTSTIGSVEFHQHLQQEAKHTRGKSRDLALRAIHSMQTVHANRILARYKSQILPADLALGGICWSISLELSEQTFHQMPEENQSIESTS